jgi:uncharacterized membrane-anchored protein
MGIVFMRLHRRISRTAGQSMLLLLLGSAPASAKSFKELFPDVTFKDGRVQQLAESFDYRQGIVPMSDGGVRLDVPDRFYFLSGSDARRVLVDVWGNPPVVAQGIEGLILPADKAPVEDSWGVVVAYDGDGYVPDEDAFRIDYGELLKSMQRTTAVASRERVRNGYGAIRLIGWASPPLYDRATHKLQWAKELQFNDGEHRTLNYDVRALGRWGVLKMNIVAGIGDLARIERVIPDVLRMPQFVAGSRYQDFVPGTDKVAAYGIAGLINGEAGEKRGAVAAALSFIESGWSLALLVLGIGIAYLTGRSSRSTPSPS